MDKGILSQKLLQQEKYRIDVSSVAKRKPIYLDESAHDWSYIKLGKSLGWNGVALKTCKTLTGFTQLENGNLGTTFGCYGTLCMYTIEFKPWIPVGISHLRNCTRFPSCLNCSHLSKGKILTRDAKSIHCIQCYALWSLAEILKPCVFSTRPKADHCLPLSLTHCNLQYLLD